jgi:hypothetical protein
MWILMMGLQFERLALYCRRRINSTFKDAPEPTSTPLMDERRAYHEISIFIAIGEDM